MNQNTVTEMKDSFDRLSSRLDMREESAACNRSIGIKIQREDKNGRVGGGTEYHIQIR